MSDLKAQIKHDEMSDKLHISHSQDIAPIIKDNIARSNEIDKHAAWGETERVASIPMVLVVEWMHKEGINVMAPSQDCLKKIKQKLNSPEYAYLRTRGGRL